jgi:hypothetical protein
MSLPLDSSFGLQISDFLTNIFEQKKQEHATNISGASVELNGPYTSIYANPLTLIDYYGMYCYPLAFIGAILFPIIQLIDVNLNTIILNKNVSLFINTSFIMWSILGLSTYYNFSLSAIPYIGPVFEIEIPYILPFNKRTVVLQY